MSLFSKRPLALCALFFLFGSLLTYLVNANGIGCLWALLPFLLFFAISLLLGICKRSPLSLLAIALSFSLLLGFLIQLGYHRRRFAPWEETDPGAPHSIIGTVVEKSEGRYAEYTVDVKELDGRPVNISLILRTDPLEISPEIYDVLSCRVYVVTKGDPYDYSRGICGMAAPLAPPTITGSSSPSLAHRLLAMRISLSERLKTGMQEEDAALLSAIFLGERTALSDATETAFRRSGLSHVLALSGLHLSILAGYLLRLLHRLRMPRAVTFPLLFLFLLGYTAATGFSYSLIRAAVMLLVAELASLLRLIPDSVTSLFLAIAAIALCTPSSISDLGLWLSFLATLGILCANELFPKLTKLKKRSRLLHATLFSLVLSTFALVFTLLLTTYSFGAFSLLSPFTNLILTPLIHLLLILAPFALLFPTVAGIPCGLVATACRAAVTFFSGLPGYISVDYLPFRLAMLLFSGYILYLLLRRLPSKAAFFCRSVPALMAVCLVLLGCHLYEKYTPTLLYSQTYNNEAVVLRTDGKVTVILNAEAEAASDALSYTLSSAHVTDIDLLILTHYHADTAAYLSALHAQIPIRTVCALPASYEEDLIARQAAIQTADALDIAITEESGTITAPGRNLRIKILADLPLSTPSHTGFLLSATYRDTEIRYFSAGIPGVLSRKDLDSFTEKADFLILGMHPTKADRTPDLSIPADCTVIVGNPEKAPEGLLLTHKKAVTATSRLYYRIK